MHCLCGWNVQRDQMCFQIFPSQFTKISAPCRIYITLTITIKNQILTRTLRWTFLDQVRPLCLFFELIHSESLWTLLDIICHYWNVTTCLDKITSPLILLSLNCWPKIFKPKLTVVDYQTFVRSSETFSHIVLGLNPAVT